MNAERNELETNTLATALNKASEGLRQGPSQGTMIYVGVGLLILLAVFVWRYLWLSSEEDSSRRWLTFDKVIFAEQAEGLAADKNLVNTPQGRLARYLEARVNLREGLNKLGSDQDAALARIKKGTELYEGLIKEMDRDPLLRQEALLGTAKGYETLGNLDKAKEFYTTLAKFKSSHGEAAAKALERLSAEGNKKADLEALAKRFGPKPAEKAPE